MDTSKEVVSDMGACDIMERSQKPDSEVQESKSIQGGILHVVTSGNGASDVVASDRLLQNRSPDSPVHEPQSNQEKNTCVASLRNGSSRGHASDVSQQSCSPDASVHEEKSNQEGTIDITPGDGLSNEVASDELKPSPHPDSRALVVQVSQEGYSPAITPEKALDDGYNWRKYGQKHVKGNEFIRSYYKCTHPTCQVKKQVERSHDGRIKDILYFGTHDHPKVQPIPLAAGSVSSIQGEKMCESSTAGAEDKSSSAHVPTSHLLESKEIPKLLTQTDNETDMRHADVGSNRTREEVYKDENSEPKRRKLECRSVDATRADKQTCESRLVGVMNEVDKADKHTGESRLVVRTASEVGIVNDGYRWRKYGQKLVKGNPNPRSYYRCSNAGCPVKKHVERASHDPKVVITTYEGQHDHDIPAARTVTPNTVGCNTNQTASNGESRDGSEESDIVGHEVVVRYSLHSESRSNEHCQPDAEPVHS